MSAEWILKKHRVRKRAEEACQVIRFFFPSIFAVFSSTTAILKEECATPLTPVFVEREHWQFITCFISGIRNQIESVLPGAKNEWKKTIAVVLFSFRV